MFHFQQFNIPRSLQRKFPKPSTYRGGGIWVFNIHIGKGITSVAYKRSKQEMSKTKKGLRPVVPKG